LFLNFKSLISCELFLKIFCCYIKHLLNEFFVEVDFFIWQMILSLKFILHIFESQFEIDITTVLNWLCFKLRFKNYQFSQYIWLSINIINSIGQKIKEILKENQIFSFFKKCTELGLIVFVNKLSYFVFLLWYSTQSTH